MIDPAAFLTVVIDPALNLVVMPPEMRSDEARVLMLAIALQESGLIYRRQVGDDGEVLETLARGWWQFERSGGVRGVCTHMASAGTAEAVCGILRVPFIEEDIHEAIAWNDVLSAVYARLLLYTDPAPLPKLGDQAAAWEYYIRNWRPGKPHPAEWPMNYALAVEAVNQNATPVDTSAHP